MLERQENPTTREGIVGTTSIVLLHKPSHRSSRCYQELAMNDLPSLIQKFISCYVLFLHVATTGWEIVDFATVRSYDDSQKQKPIITSLYFDPPWRQRSEYVEYTFGGKAMSYPATLRKAVARSRITEDELAAARSSFRRAFSAPDRLVRNCAIHLLAYLVRGSKSAYFYEVQENITGTAAVGKARLEVFSKKDNKTTTRTKFSLWNCYYRDVWRPVTYDVSELLFYCPASSWNHCDNIMSLSSSSLNGRNSQRRKGGKNATSSSRVMLHASKNVDQPHWLGGKGMVPMTLTLDTLVEKKRLNAPNRGQWKLHFEGNIHATLKRNFAKRYRPKTSTIPENNVAQVVPPTMAVCTVLSYSSSFMGGAKDSIVNTILYEWSKYYVKLGFRVLIFDRSQAHLSAPLQILRDLRDTSGEPVVVYNNYTIFQVTQGKGPSVKYDNTEALGESVDAYVRRMYTDNDKEATLSQCRHEAYGRWGISDVLVADPDEFLVCPNRTLQRMTANDQKTTLRRYLREAKQQNRTFAYISQRIPSNTTAEPIMSCLKSKIQTNQSIFGCYGRYQDVVMMHSVKSFYFGYKCPFTSYHDSENRHGLDRAYDCGDGESYVPSLAGTDEGKACALIHLSTNQDNFKRPCCWTNYYDEAQRRELKDMKLSEIWQIMNS